MNILTTSEYALIYKGETSRATGGRSANKGTANTIRHRLRNNMPLPGVISHQLAGKSYILVVDEGTMMNYKSLIAKKDKKSSKKLT